MEGEREGKVERDGEGEREGEKKGGVEKETRGQGSRREEEGHQTNVISKIKQISC